MARHTVRLNVGAALLSAAIVLAAFFVFTAATGGGDPADETILGRERIDGRPHLAVWYQGAERRVEVSEGCYQQAWLGKLVSETSACNLDAARADIAEIDIPPKR